MLRLYVLPLKSVRLCALSQTKRQQKAVFLFGQMMEWIRRAGVNDRPVDGQSRPGPPAGGRIHPRPPSKKPLLSTTTKEVFSCILGEKRAKYCEIGLRSGRSATSEPDFLRSSPGNGQ